MKKRILIFIPCLIVMVLVVRIVFVAIEQKKEFNFHKNIPKSIKLWSDDFKPDNSIPTEFTILGDNLSPSLYWDNLPSETRSLVITVVDYDAPSPIIKFTTIDHWIIFNIHPEIKHLEKAVTSQELMKSNMSLGTNITGGTDYVGPNPPFGTHKYYFRIYALSIPDVNVIKPTKKILMERMKGNIIAYGELIGKYKK